MAMVASVAWPRCCTRDLHGAAKQGGYLDIRLAACQAFGAGNIIARSLAGRGSVGIKSPGGGGSPQPRGVRLAQSPPVLKHQAQVTKRADAPWEPGLPGLVP
jgi:hypothetical protein